MPSIFHLCFISLVAIPAGVTAEPMPATAHDAVPSPAEHEPWLHGRLVFQIENDRFATGSDRYYTNGLQLAWISGNLSDHGKIPDAVQTVSGVFPGCHSPNDVYRARLSLGQDIYTPGDITRRIPNPNDRPYAGWLYGSFGLGRYNQDTTDILELSLGMVGPASLAEETQKTFHDLGSARISSNQIRGWDNQLPNEFGFMIAYQKRWLFRGEQDRAINWDFSGGGGVVLGTIETYGNLSGTLRAGYHLPDNLPYEPIGPGRSLGESYGRGTSKSNGFRIYFLAGVEGRAIARDIFLDGSTYQDSPSVSKRHAVAEARAGGGIGYGPFNLEYAFVAQTEEFKGQDGPQYFGSIVGSLDF